MAQLQHKTRTIQLKGDGLKWYIVLGIFVLCIIFMVVLVYIYKGKTQTGAEHFTEEEHNEKNNKINKKIAFCFLINNSINHEEIWYEYLKTIDPNKYNIYIHYKDNQPLKYFDDKKIKTTIPTCYGCLSVVLAQNLILNEALNDHDNQHFIWLSESCIPLKSFDYVYNYLDTTKSYFNISPDEQVFPRANPVLEYLEKERIKKAAMPSIINRKHAQLFADNNDNIKLWFQNIDNVDEIVFITLLYHFGLENELVLTPNLAADAIIFAGWEDLVNYKSFPESKLTKTRPNEYDFICNEELDFLVNSKSLFGRKFNKGCKGLTELLSKLGN